MSIIVGKKKKEILSTQVNENKTLTEFLTEHELFKDLSKKERNEIALSIDIKRYSPGRIILRKDKHANRFLLLTQGNVYIEKTKEPKPSANSNSSQTEEASAQDSRNGSLFGSIEGAESFLVRKASKTPPKTLKAGEAYGLMSLVHSSHYWPSNVRAATEVTDVIVLEISREKYIELEAKDRKCIRALKSLVEETREENLMLCLKQVPFLKGFPDSLFKNLRKVNYFKFEACDEYVTYIDKGEALDCIYILLSGEVVIADKNTDELITEYDRIKPGMTFGMKTEGETDTAWATYRTLKKCTFFKVSKVNLEDLCLRVPVLKNILRTEKIRVENAKAMVKSSSLFKHVSRTSKKFIIAQLKQVVFQPGSILRKAGEKSHRKFYFITAGKVDVILNDKKLKSLSSGQYFGESSLLSKAKNSATISVSSKELCKCLVLDGKDFSTFIENEPCVEAELMFKMNGFSTDFEYLVSHPTLKASFLKFAEKENVEGSVHFLSAMAKVEAFNRKKTKKVVVRSFGFDVHQVKSTKVNLLRKKLGKIYQQFFENQVLNLSSPIYEEVHESFKSGDYGYIDVFNTAKSAIRDNLDFDKYGRFKKTQGFNNFLLQVGVYSSTN